MTAVSGELQAQADLLYERYGKPLETEHQDRYVAIFPDGTTVVADTVHDAVQEALDTVGRGSFVFKLGEKAVWKWR